VGVSKYRLRTKLVGIQPPSQLGEGAVALGEEFEYQRQCEYGLSEEQIVIYLFFAGNTSIDQRRRLFRPPK
jgi:hypothetical protein